MFCCFLPFRGASTQCHIEWIRFVGCQGGLFEVFYLLGFHGSFLCWFCVFFVFFLSGMLDIISGSFPLSPSADL